MYDRDISDLSIATILDSTDRETGRYHFQEEKEYFAELFLKRHPKCTKDMEPWQRNAWCVAEKLLEVEVK